MSSESKKPKSLRWEKRRIRRAGGGDREAFADLYREFAGPIYARILLPRLGDAAAAEDALAETFRAALQNLGQYQSRGSSIFHWLARIAKNKAMDLHRQEARSQRKLCDFHRLLSPLAPAESEPEFESRKEQDRLRARIQTVLKQIRPRYAQVIELRFLAEKTRADCADIMAVKLGTLDVLLLRALRAFRVQWQEFEKGDPNRE